MRIAVAMWVSLVGISSAAADPPPAAEQAAAIDECAQLARAANDPSPTTEIAIGDCYTRAGNAAQAASWYRDAAHKQLPVEPPGGTTAAIAAEPDHRDSWRIAMWSSFAVAAVGVGTYIYGRAEIDDASSQLCAGGAYATNPSCGYTGMPLTYQQVASLNEQGERGQTLARVGLGLALVGGGVAGYSLYRAYFGHETRVVVAPVVAPGTGGAQLSLRW